MEIAAILWIGRGMLAVAVDGDVGDDNTEPRCKGSEDECSGWRHIDRLHYKSKDTVLRIRRSFFASYDPEVPLLLHCAKDNFRRIS